MQPLNLNSFLPTLLCTNGSHGMGMTGIMRVIGNIMSVLMCVHLCCHVKTFKKLTEQMCTMFECVFFYSNAKAVLI